MNKCRKCGKEKELIEFLKYDKNLCKECRRPISLVACRKFAKNNPFKASRRYEYGLTEEQFNSMLISQGCRCKLCRELLSQRNTRVDHNHINGKIRGILCSKCNSGLGQFNDDIRCLTSAIKYLEENNDFA